MVDLSQRFLKIPETQKRFPLITCFYYDEELCYHQVFSKGKITTPDEGGARSNIWRINFGNAGLKSISLCFKGDRSGTIHVDIQLWETFCSQEYGPGSRGGLQPRQILGNSVFLGSKRKFGQSYFLKTFPCFFYQFKETNIFYFNLKKILKSA